MTTTTQHTPGPWTVRWQDSKLYIDAANIYICAIIQYGMPMQNRGYYVHEEANARLIAACPTMYNFIKAEAEQGNKKAIDLLNSIN